jgi:GT2 family glycosyltransferase
MLAILRHLALRICALTVFTQFGESSIVHVSLAIVGFRNPNDILECLGALELSTHKDFDVVICENGGAAAYAELASRVPSSLAGGQSVVVIQAQRNLGYAGGVNVCIEAKPKSDAWWVLNPDTLPEPDAMAKLVDRLEAGDCDAAGSTVMLTDKVVQSFGGRWEAWLGRAVSIGYGAALPPPDTGKIESVQNYLNGASMMIGRRFLKAAGLMREDYFLYCEEVAWCLHALRTGMRLGFARDAVVLHHAGTSMNNFKELPGRGRLPVYLRERNRVLLTKDYFPKYVIPVTILGVPLLLYRYGRTRSWDHCIYGLKGLWAGVIGERGVPPWLSA